VSRPLALAMLLLAAPTAARDAPVLLLPPGLGRPNVVWISGRVLEEDHARRGPQAYRTARTLTGSSVEGAAIEVTFLGRTARTTSGEDGEFEVAIEPAAGESFWPGPHLAAVRVAEVTASARVLVVAPGAPFLLVSDLDDTVAVTNVTSTTGMLAATFLEDAESQPAVAGMAPLYRCLAARGAPVAFVSGTPAQLAPRVTRFLEKNGFPEAALHLRNLEPKTLHGYKEPVLEKLADRFPGLPMVLVGDTGERDPEIYAAFSAAHPGRVARTYLRQSTPDAVPPARLAGALLFREPVVAARDAAARGLADPACVAAAFPPAAP
jgi:phosphatidate phosphatase APP1